ncbi:MAG: hypothetical protein Q9P01_18700 [Anaerolineae bacterium]|nr:hypothetical protein [Anaerolineae bacterium]MDQ7036784.1 hypothetical protein [Anaerolineae bacterium]
MNETKTHGLACITPLYMRLATVMIGIIGYVAIFTVVDERVTILSLIFWTYILVRIQFYAPDLVVYDSGIELNRYGFKTFWRWQDIQYVRVGRFNSQIFPTTIPRWLRLILGYDSLLINSWRGNYKAAMQLVEERVQTANEQVTQRVYE